MIQNKLSKPTTLKPQLTRPKKKLLDKKAMRIKYSSQVEYVYKRTELNNNNFINMKINWNTKADKA